MKREKFITVMAILDDDTQVMLRNIQKDFERLYGLDMKTKDIPFHITLGSYAVEETSEIVARIQKVAEQTEKVYVEFNGIKHFGNVVRYIEPEISEELLNLHMHFDSDYANGYSEWMPHITLYRHSEPSELKVPEEIIQKMEKVTHASIVGIELGEFFPMKKISRVLFD